LDPKVRDLGLTLGRKHRLNRLPYANDDLYPVDMRKNLGAIRLKEVAGNGLIPGNPSEIVRIGNRFHRLICCGFVSRLHHQHLWCAASEPSKRRKKRGQRIAGNTWARHPS
jgi:hypothetical protein